MVQSAGSGISLDDSDEGLIMNDKSAVSDFLFNTSGVVVHDIDKVSLACYSPTSIGSKVMIGCYSRLSPGHHQNRCHY